MHSEPNNPCTSKRVEEKGIQSVRERERERCRRVREKEIGR